MHLTTLSWALATLLLRDAPLLDSIASQSSLRIDEFNTQGITNTAWAFAKLPFPAAALTDDALAAVMRKLADIVDIEETKEANAHLWAMWRTQGSSSIEEEFSRRALCGNLPDSLVYSFLLMTFEWRGCACGSVLESFIWSGNLPSLHTRQEKPVVDAYKKMGQLMDYMAATLHPSPQAVLSRIESFAHGYGQWLKVAGGDKALCTESSLNMCAFREWETMLEYGAFVGYSSVRFGNAVLGQMRSHTCGYRLTSCEVDPVHACVARSHIDMAALSHVVEVAVGKLNDTTPLLHERAGTWACTFGFMDQRGTAFHQDFVHLEELMMLGVHSRVTADNVVKPGAPCFLWALRNILPHRLGACQNSTFWAMTEFAQEEVEDWQSVTVLM